MVPVEERHLVLNDDKWLILITWHEITEHFTGNDGRLRLLSVSYGDRLFTLLNIETALMECMGATVNIKTATCEDICLS